MNKNANVSKIIVKSKTYMNLTKVMARMDYVATHAYSGNADWDMQSINTIYQRWAMMMKVKVMISEVNTGDES